MASHGHSRSRSPSLQKRSLSPGYDGERRRKHDGGDREKDAKPLPHEAQPLNDADYFLKNAEFRAWLKEEKSIFFDELSGEKARSYFHKFVKAWNRGKLPETYYSGEVAVNQRATAQTAYRWSFAEKRTRVERDTISEARDAVETATRSKNPGDASTVADVPATSRSSRGESSRVIGPTPPPASDRVLMREAQDEARATKWKYERKRGREEDKARIEDLVGPRERGREGMLEKKKVKREADRTARDAKDDTLGEYDDSTLMGGGDSFQARIAQRDAARRRFEEKRADARGEKEATVRERQEAIRAKDKATMDMFKQMAREKFGG